MEELNLVFKMKLSYTSKKERRYRAEYIYTYIWNLETKLCIYILVHIQLALFWANLGNYPTFWPNSPALNRSVKHVFKKFQMLFEQNIASNVTRNVGQLLGTYRNLLNLKKREIFDFKKRLTEEEERRKKEEQSSLQIRLKRLRRIIMLHFKNEKKKQEKNNTYYVGFLYLKNMTNIEVFQYSHFYQV